jgi:hypothetical protein
MSMQEAESRFSQTEVAHIKREFEKNSKDQIIGKRKLIEFFKITEISDTYLSNELFNIIKNSNKLNLPIDYQKFISFIAILVKGSRFEKLLLIFSIFGKGVPLGEAARNGSQGLLRDESSVYESDNDSDELIKKKMGNKMFNSRGSLIGADDDEDGDENEAFDPRITKEDMKLHISGTILSMVNVNFDNGAIEGLKQSICRSDEQLIDDALDIMIDDIFNQYAVSSKDDGLNFEEWCEWFTSLDGINEMLNLPSSF